MTHDSSRRDRTARLLNLANLLYQHPHGLLPREIARRLAVSVRTVYRDLKALEEEVGIPFWQDGSRYGVERRAFLPPLQLSLHEAVTLFLSTRLMARFADKRTPYALSAFQKLSTVLPAAVADHVLATAAVVAERPSDETYDRVFDLLATGWADGRKVRIWYPFQHPDGRGFVNERIVAPYYLEPSATGHACYLIGHDAFSNQVRTFKVERIQKAELTEETFQIPRDFDAMDRFQQAWGVSDADAEEVVLRFRSPQAVKRALETRWHPSQQEQVEADGGLTLRFTVSGLLEITPWVLGWGDAVEVLQPKTLREHVAHVARNLAKAYADVLLPQTLAAK